jgi:hypothetical protein
MSRYTSLKALSREIKKAEALASLLDCQLSNIEHRVRDLGVVRDSSFQAMLLNAHLVSIRDRLNRIAGMRIEP